MSEKQKQIEYELDYTIEIGSNADGEHWWQILDEQSIAVDGRDNNDYYETRSDALAAAEHELNTMFNEWYDEYLTEKHKD